MKKVLFTATVDSHILQFHLPFLKLFKEKGYEVHVATNGTEKIPYCDVKHVVCFERSPLKLNNLKAIKQLKNICDKEQFDVIHCHTPMGSVVTRLAAKSSRKKYNTRVIYTAHGFHFFKGASIKNWLLFYPVEWYLSKYTDTLITINLEDYELAKNKFSKRCKDIEYVPGVGIDEEKFNFTMSKKEKAELRESIGLKDDDFILTYIARLDANKNQGFLIKVMKDIIIKYPNIHLLLIGPDEINGLYKEQAKDILNNVHFLGYRKDIPKLLKITDISVSSSLREGLPVNILEAMASGVPIIATDARGVRDLIKNGENGYIVDINNKEEFIDKILILYNNEKLRKEISKKNFEVVKNYYLVSIIEYLKIIYNEKTKVLHLLSSNVYSGAENVACTIINNSDKDKYEMVYCSPNGKILEQLKEKNIDYIPLVKLSYSEVKRTIKDYKPNIIHAHDNKATVIATLFRKKCKIISHIHGNNKIMNTLNLKTLLFNLRSKYVNRFIWVSDSSLNDYYFKNNIVDKSIVLHNVINQKEIIKKSKLYKCDREYDLIFLGRLGYPKNVVRFIKIVKMIKKKKNDVNVAIVGDGPDRNQIENLIEDYNLINNIKVYGFQSNPYPILNNSKILVMTSIYEGTPMCALEAQSLGKPIIATPVDGLIDIVENGYNGFLSNIDEELVDNILLILNKKNYSYYSKNSIDRFKEINGLENYLKTIKDIYEGD